MSKNPNPDKQFPILDFSELNWSPEQIGEFISQLEPKIQNFIREGGIRISSLGQLHDCVTRFGDKIDRMSFNRQHQGFEFTIEYRNNIRFIDQRLSCDEVWVSSNNIGFIKYSDNISFGQDGLPISCDKAVLRIPESNQTIEYSTVTLSNLTGQPISCLQVLHTFPDGKTVSYYNVMEINEFGRVVGAGHVFVNLTDGTIKKYHDNVRMNKYGEPKSANQVEISLPSGQTRTYSSNSSFNIREGFAFYESVSVTLLSGITLNYSSNEGFQEGTLPSSLREFSVTFINGETLVIMNDVTIQNNAEQDVMFVKPNSLSDKDENLLCLIVQEKPFTVKLGLAGQKVTKFSITDGDKEFEFDLTTNQQDKKPRLASAESGQPLTELVSLDLYQCFTGESETINQPVMQNLVENLRSALADQSKNPIEHLQEKYVGKVTQLNPRKYAVKPSFSRLSLPHPPRHQL